MKKILLTMMVVLAGAFAASADTYSTDRATLPEGARSVLTKYFPKAKIGIIKTEKHMLQGTEYDVRLADGMKIEFDGAGNWTEVDCRGREVPAGMIPEAVRNYVRRTYPDSKIVEAENKTNKFKVELNDGLELTFDRQGNLKKVDLDR